jgi:methylmalonyl-CoA mutase
MSDKSIDKVLQECFPKSRKGDWKNIATREIDGRDPHKVLSWRGKDEILFLPYYDDQDVANLDFLSKFQIPPSVNAFSGARFWVNLPSVQVKDEKTGNKQSLEHLSNGAEGVLFTLEQSSDVKLHELMNNIQWPYCFVAFRVTDNFIPNALAAFIQTKFEPASVHGALFWESIPKINNLDFYFRSCPHLKSLGLIIPFTSPAVEIGEALFQGVQLLRTVSSNKDVSATLNAISFSLSLDHAFMESVAKLKALRMLWYQVALAYGQKDYKIQDLHIHVQSLSRKRGSFNAPEILLQNTFVAISAVLGGCDSLTLHTDGDGEAQSRLLRNVSVILREESFFNKVADPLAGSFALDAMVNEIAKKAWGLFQLKLQSYERA